MWFQKGNRSSLANFYFNIHRFIPLLKCEILGQFIALWKERAQLYLECKCQSCSRSLLSPLNNVTMYNVSLCKMHFGSINAKCKNSFKRHKPWEPVVKVFWKFPWRYRRLAWQHCQQYSSWKFKQRRFINVLTLNEDSKAVYKHAQMNKPLPFAA